MSTLVNSVKQMFLETMKEQKRRRKLLAGQKKFQKGTMSTVTFQRLEACVRL